jgi:hypothetical protein
MRGRLAVADQPQNDIVLVGVRFVGANDVFGAHLESLQQYRLLAATGLLMVGSGTFLGNLGARCMDVGATSLGGRGST